MPRHNHTLILFRLQASTRVKELLKEMTALNESELAAEQKYIDRARRIDAANAEKRMRELEKDKSRAVRKTARKKISVADALPQSTGPVAAPDAAPLAPAVAAPSAPAAVVPVTPVQPQPTSAPSAVPPAPAAAQAAPVRGALLGSIQGFSKGGLKKAETNDRSAPTI